MQQGRLLSLLVHSTSKFELFVLCTTGANPGFQVRGLHLKKLRRAKGGAKIVGVFRLKNHDFTPKNHIFSNFRGDARRLRPPLDPPLTWSRKHYTANKQLSSMNHTIIRE